MATIQRINMDGARLVLMPEAEYERLREQAGLSKLPPLPPADEHGNRPAAAYMTALMARDMIRLRESAGMSREELATRAGVRLATVIRAESGKGWISDASHRKLLTVLAPEELKSPASRRQRSRPSRKAS